MKCIHCHAEIDDSMTHSGYCPYCGSSQAPVARVSGSQDDSSWENDFKSRPFHSYVETIKAVLFSPSVFFSRLQTGGGLFALILFATINQIIGMVGAMGIQIVFSLTSVAMKGAIFQKVPLDNILSTFFTPVALIILVALSPLLAVMSLFVQAAVTHVCLLLVGGNKKGFDATLAVAGYSTSAQVFQIVPILGSFVSAIYQIVLLIIGIKETHGTSGGKAAFAVLLPFMLCCCCFAMIFGVVISGALMTALPR